MLGLVRRSRLFSNVFTKMLFGKSTFPLISLTHSIQDNNSDQLYVISKEEAPQYLPPHKAKQFMENQTVTLTETFSLPEQPLELKEIKKIYYNHSTISKKLSPIEKDLHVSFSPNVQKLHHFTGLASNVLSSAYKFTRKQAQKQQKHVKISSGNFEQKQYITELANTKIRASEWANMRGNEGTPQYFLKQAQRIVSLYPEIELTVIRGEELLEKRFNLMHAVGRASKNEPIFICMTYKGCQKNSSDSDQYHALIGKGLCFDAGGLNIKPTSGISGMHLDKHGACSVLSAFQSIAKLKLKSNVVAALGFAENFISSNSFRPLDIIQSRKGITVEIGNTDAEGRLVLADVMSYVQEHYKIKSMIELSTLTGAIVVALGKDRAGLFSNNDSFSQKITKSSDEILEKVWRMPLDEYHADIIKGKQADITNSSGKGDASSSQAAAFLQRFVENSTPWIHLDIAGTGMAENNLATGYGARLLLNYIKNSCQL